MTDDERGLLATIIVAPDDDKPRLVFADWLDEQDTAPDRQYARFIRSQVRGEVFSLSLVASLRFESMFGGQPHTWRKNASAGVCEVGAANGVFVFRRGMVDEVCLPLAAFVGGECRRCDGNGHYFSRNPHSDREGQGGSVWCRACSGVGRDPGLAAALFAAHPVTRVVLTDREPTNPHPPDGWMWFKASQYRATLTDDPSYLPDELFDLLPTDGTDYRTRTQGDVEYRTREAALAALSAACVSYGRIMAKLNPL